MFTILERECEINSIVIFGVSWSAARQYLQLIVYKDLRVELVYQKYTRNTSEHY